MTYNLVKHNSGNLQFSLCIAGELPKEAIKLSHPVSNITQSPSSNCVVPCDASMSNFAFRVKKVIVSEQRPLYSHIAFSPPLPAAKSAAATFSFLGYFSKSIVVYDSSWWRERSTSGVCNSNCGPIGFTREACIEQGDQFSMICFMVSYAGRERSKYELEGQRHQVAEQIRTIFGAKGGDALEPRKFCCRIGPKRSRFGDTMSCSGSWSIGEGQHGGH
jgi:monoamine oxidase